MSSGNTMESSWQVSQLNATSSGYVDGLYEAYLEDPNSVDASWRTYFAGLQKSIPGQADVAHEGVREAFIQHAQHPTGGVSSVDAGDAHDLVAVLRLIDAYRSLGNRRADLDPLQLRAIPTIVELTLAHYGLSNSDLDRTFDIRTLGYTQPVTLREIIATVERIYCGHLSVEYMHATSSTEKDWWHQQLETKATERFSPAQKRWAHQRLVAADGLEKYLGMKFTGQKRFSLEGGDALIPLLDQMIAESVRLGTREVVLGMAHRGRLNVLVNVLGKSPDNLVAEFEGKHHDSLLSGDVKYHNGFSSNVQTVNGPVHIAMAFNPSHLEIVSPVVAGSVRARLDRSAAEQNSILPITIHGDSAFTGQGVVMETFNFSQARGFTIGGTVRVIINNQVGFTTSDPRDTRSSWYCTDISKMVEAPVIHINGDDAEAVLWGAQLALAYRERFHKDVVIDLVCYRLHGHNESDEPSGTQPIMYRAIRAHQTPFKLYGERLAQAGILSAEEATAEVNRYREQLEAGKPVVTLVDAPGARKGAGWSPYLGVAWDAPCSTQIDRTVMLTLAKAMNAVPAGFALQPQVAKALADRDKMTTGELPVNWGYAELLAYATLLQAGHSVRLCGQDSGRGTFSHRHAALHEYNTGERYLPLTTIAKAPTRLDIIDSVLSEEAVLAFEYGYACSAPNDLVIWEAQFGDFANGAQVVIDQFISSAEEKWGRLCGLTLFLPHGYEGMGAEHSSARIERFLQLCAHDNIQVCVPTTPAQHFHLLRRQMLRPYRKPLVVMTPKSLLRHPLVVSNLDDLAKGEFQLVLDEIDALAKKDVKRVVLCQGKVYYDLLAKRRDAKIQDIAIVRLEQLYPYPTEALKAILAQYTNAKEWIWCQEEPQNQGAWTRVLWFMSDALPKGQTLRYVGRKAFAAPAVGYPQLHKDQQAALVNEALSL